MRKLLDLIYLLPLPLSSLSLVFPLWSPTSFPLLLQTDATMTELEIEANMKLSDWSIIQEAGQQLTPCYGPGYTGLVNLGNSCYLNSVVQVLFSLDEFKQR